MAGRLRSGLHDLAAHRAVQEVEAGFTAVKFDPAGPYTVYDGHMPSLEVIQRCAAFCGTIREAVGTRADLLFGTHGQFTAAGAIRLARALEPHDPLWFEEPVPPDNVAEMARVARQTSIPVATGERLTTKYEFARVIEALANIQFATCTPNFLILESIRDFGGFHAELLSVPIEWVDGDVIPPTGPGIGADLDEDVARAHPWTGDQLHLEMQEHPETP